MATLDVQRKQKSPLPWILLTLLLLALVGFFVWKQYYSGDKVLPATTDSTNNIGVDTTINR